MPNYDSFFPGTYNYVMDVRDFEVYKDGLLLGTTEGLFYVNYDFSNIEKINTDDICRGETVYTLINNKEKLYANVGWNTATTGLWTSDDSGNTWDLIKNELRGKFMSSIDVNDSLIVTGSFYSGYPWISTDNGKTFEEKTTGLEKSNNIISIKIYDDTLYLGTLKGIYFSTNNGNRWDNLSNIINNNIINDLIKIGKRIIVATNDKILLSEDSCVTWSEVSMNKNAALRYKIKTLTVCSRTIFATCEISKLSDYSVIGGTIFASNDTGRTWFEVNRGLPNLDGIKPFCCYKNHIFSAGSYNVGVYYTFSYNAEGIFWQPINYGLTNRYITSLITDGKYLYAGTSEGVYRLFLGDLGIVNVDDSQINVKPDYLWASVAYPNPARDYVQAKVWWDTHNDIEKAEIVVYDVYGNRVSGRDRVTIIPENDFSGLIRWDCSNFPSGVYILTIQHGTRRQAVRMIKE